MRAVLIALAIAGLPGIAKAQPLKLENATGHHVYVIDQDKREWQGLLLSVSVDELVIEDDEGVHNFALAKVRRVDADGDGVKDGALKGAVFGGVLGLLFLGAHGSDGRSILAGAMVYGLIGAGLDALNHGKQTVYRRRAAQMGFTIRW